MTSPRNCAYTLFAIILLLPSIACTKLTDNRLDLSGSWTCRLDPCNLGIDSKWFNTALEIPVRLPGSLDENRLGNKVVHDLNNPAVLNHLGRPYTYTGAAWYQRKITIPPAWQGMHVKLSLERVLWESQAWIDDKPLGMQESLVVPHVYHLGKLSPGTHTLTIRVDNSFKYNICYSVSRQETIGSAYTEDSQTIWNGIIGRLDLTASPAARIDSIQIYPDLDKHLARVEVLIQSDSNSPVTGSLNFQAALRKGSSLAPAVLPVNLKPGLNTISYSYPMDEDFKAWSEFTPDLYDMSVVLDCGPGNSSSSSVTFGMRSFTEKDGSFILNGKRVFLRGALDAAAFPLTGYPAMSLDQWKAIFLTCRDYGLNHIRFHSWCPPEAAFAAADEVGFYLQPELPIWLKDFRDAGKNAPRDAFIKAEARRILASYANHPSFCLLSMGNEIYGGIDFLNKWVLELRSLDSRCLFSTTTCSYGDNNWLHNTSDQFFVSQKSSKGWMRAQGFINSKPPRTDFDLDPAVRDINVPVVAHEIGQQAVFPRMKEIQKYTGVLVPSNFESIRQSLARKGLLAQADDFTLASGRLAANLYKAEIELILRSRLFDGFQLLGLSDYPGQGTALTGMLDAFWQSKGIISGPEYRRFCSPTVPLILMPKYVYKNSEHFTAAVQLSHFGPNDISLPFQYKLSSAGATIASGSFDKKLIPTGSLADLGEIDIDLSIVKSASKLELSVFAPGTQIFNSWNIWVFPAALPPSAPVSDLLITSVFDANAKAHLASGKTLLLSATAGTIKKWVPAHFGPVYWGTIHCPGQPEGMGILCNPAHPALVSFPTDFHSDWQWFDLTGESVAIDIDSLPQQLAPIVQVVDDFVTNRKLAYIFEARVGPGKLLVCSLDISTDLDTRIAARQLRHSLLDYIASSRFNPTVQVSTASLESLFQPIPLMKQIKSVTASSSLPAHPASALIDSDPFTYWQPSNDPCTPYELLIDIGRVVKVTGFKLTAPQGISTPAASNIIAFAAVDPNIFGQPIVSAEFSASQSSPQYFPLTGRYRIARDSAKAAVRARCIKFRFETPVPVSSLEILTD